jgi:hypothetical protein
MDNLFFRPTVNLVFQWPFAQLEAQRGVMEMLLAFSTQVWPEDCKNNFARRRKITGRERLTLEIESCPRL